MISSYTRFIASELTLDFWMNHIRGVSIIKKNLTRGPFIAAANIRDFAVTWALRGVRRPRPELSQREGSPAHAVSLPHTQRTPNAPSTLQGKSYSLLTVLHEIPLAANIAGGTWFPWSLFYSTQCWPRLTVQTTLRIQFLPCSKGTLISTKYQIIIIYKVEKDICLSFYICAMK